jgi:hypothetical protein
MTTACTADHAKLLLLATCLAACLLTLFTGSSFRLGDRDLPVLVPGAAAAGSSKHCVVSSSVENRKRCWQVVRKAYGHVNTAGCLREIQSKALCELEWCAGSEASDRHIEEQRQSCLEECSAVRQELEHCIDSTVLSYLERYGIINQGDIIETKD